MTAPLGTAGRLLVLVSTLFGAACAEEADSEAGDCGGRPCGRDCRALADGNCDVLEPACRQRILDAVICVRGTGGSMPTVRTLTPEEYRRELERVPDAGTMLDASVDPDEDAGGPDTGGAPADAGVPAVPGWTAGLRLLGLIASDQDTSSAYVEQAVSEIAGYYSGATQRITLIDRGHSQDTVWAMSLFAHELVHALQDQEIGFAELAARTAGSSDSALARGCLTEGEATLYEELAIALLHGFTLDPVALAVRTRRSLKHARSEVLRASSPAAAVWQLEYPVGLSYLAAAYHSDGHDAVRRLYWSPPLSTIHWMHGYGASREPDELLVLALACNEASAPSGFEWIQSGSMGPFHVFAFLGRLLRAEQVFESEAHWQHALQWRQDELTLFLDAAGAAAVSWRIRFADPALASVLAERLRAQSVLELEALVHGDELEILASDAPSVLAGWRGTDPASCPAP